MPPPVPPPMRPPLKGSARAMRPGVDKRPPRVPPPPKPPATRKLGMSREQAVSMSFSLGMCMGIFIAFILFLIATGLGVA